MRSTGGFVPVWVWMSYGFMARGKSVRNHQKCLGHMKQRARAGLGVVLVYGPWKVRTKSPKCLVTWSSQAVHGPHTGQKLDNLWVIPQHAVRARKLYRRYLDPYGRHSARSWKLSLHNFPTRASYDFQTTDNSPIGRPYAGEYAHRREDGFIRTS